VLLVDTFNTYFETANARAAVDVLQAAGYNVILPATAGRPLCCGRTFLSSGLVDEARSEVRRTLDALLPYVEAGTPVVGLEPSCLLTFRDEALSLLPGPQASLLAQHCFLIEEFLDRERAAERLQLDLRPLGGVQRALVHGHCHQKAFGAMPSVQRVLALIPELSVEVIDSSCCGMAGTFGYEAEHFGTSLQMAGLKLLPAVRAADDETIVIADGVSCRHQIRDGAQRDAIHVVRVLAAALSRA
jgi:Fe-S oxidoreductase